MRILVAGLVLLGLSACQMMTAPTEPDAVQSTEEVDGFDPLAGEKEDRPQQPAEERSRENELLKTDREAYAPGSTAVVVLENMTAEPLGQNLCFTILEQGFNAGWQAAPFQPTDVCTSQLQILQPGETASWTFELDSRLQPGLYRFRSTVEQIRTGERMDVVSNTFNIVR